MIALGKQQLNDPDALKKRLDYVNELLTESRPSVSPSSQEWVSAEFWNGHMNELMNERDEIQQRLKILRRQ